jgi:uncharacterized protein DUF5666
VITRILRLSLFMLVPAVALAVGCGSESSLSPTAPSRAGATRVGAVIMGRVTGFSRAATAPDAFTTLATTSLTVTIVGTNISTNVDGNGQFTLTGVPPGDVQVKFSGSGADATILLSGVSATDRITITVSLNGRNARVESERRDHDDDGEDDDDDENELKGPVSNLSGSCPTLTFTIQGTTVKTNNGTRFEHGQCARVANGRRVEVEGRRQADGTLLATEVEIDD